MKGRKLLSLALALVLVLGLAAPALAAETHADFPDLLVINPTTKKPQWEWAWPTIDDAIARGLFIGYADGNFGPGDPVTESVGLTLVARMVADKDLREAILKDRLTQMRTIIPGSAKDPDDPDAPFVWFRREAATCLELGIITEDELISMCKNDRLGETMTKADFAKHLISAMGLEGFAEGLPETMDFADDKDITAQYRPSVNMLATYGVLTGDEVGNFNPNSGMSRAVCATMLSRAMENIQEDRGVTVELPRYTDYKFDEGYIQSVALQDDGSRTMILKSDISGTHTVTLPGGVSIYQYNMKAGTTELRTGTFAKVCYDDQGKVDAVRLTPADQLRRVEGVCDAVTLSSVTVEGETYALDRFTEIEAGGKTGDRSIIDLKSAYTDAELVLNSRGVVVSLVLTGGSRLVEGILVEVTTSASGKTTATVNDFTGLPTTYDVPDDLIVTVDGKSVETLRSSYRGNRVVLRVSDEDLSELLAVEVDSLDKYIQGVLGTVRATSSPRRAEIRLTGNSKTTPYEVADECIITYEGEPRTLGSLPANTFVTAKVEGGATLTYLSAWSGLDITEGQLTGLTYADPTVLEVTKEDGTVSKFSIPMADLSGVEIFVDGEEADITKLSTGDTVAVTLNYHEVIQIDVTPRSADVTGILSAVSFTDSGVVLTVRFSDGSTKDYIASNTTTVTRSGKTVALTELSSAQGQTVSLVTEGSRALSIQYSGAATSQDSVEGEVISRDDQARIVILLVRDVNTGVSKLINVHIASGVALLDVNTGNTLSNSGRIKDGATITAYGSYNPDGIFEAKSVVCK